MDYDKIKELMPSAIYLYGNITDEDMLEITGSVYTTEYNGISYLGTSMPIESLAEKEILAPVIVEEPITIVEEVTTNG